MFTLYDLSFVFFVSLTAIAVVGSAAGIVIQAQLPEGGAADWNVFIVVGSYVALAFISALIWLNRRRVANIRLHAIPKAYVPVKEGDVPKEVVQLIAAEYSRACAIGYLAQPTAGHYPGWGAPGTPYEDINFRRAILNTLPSVCSQAQRVILSLPKPTPHARVTKYLQPLSNLINMVPPQGTSWEAVERYDILIQLARYGSPDQPPTSEHYETCVALVAELERTFETIRAVAQPDIHSLASSKNEWSISDDDRSFITSRTNM